MTNQPPKGQSRHRRLWQRMALTTTLVSAAAAATSSKGDHDNLTNNLLSSSSLTTSQHNLHRPVHPPHNNNSHRSLAINPNLINYKPTTNQAGYTQTELIKLSQQIHGAPHTWDQCPKSYLGYRASYDCTAYIYCTNGKMKEEGYVNCQEGLLFDNVAGSCVWETEMTCDPESFIGSSSSGSSSGEDASETGGTTTTTTTTTTYSKRMNSVTSNPRYTDAASDSSSSQWSGHGDWGGYWQDGKWIEETDSSSSSATSTNNVEDVEILSWSKEDVTTFPLPQLKPYETETTTLPREFISQEGWSSTSRHGKKVIGYYTNWQWYANQERASPVNMQFSKVDRVVFAFFQMSEGGEIWGMDDWADGGILFGQRNWSVEVPEDIGYAPQFFDNNGFNDKQGSEWNYVGDKYVDVGENIYCHRKTPSGPRDCNGHHYDKGLIGRAHSQGAEVYISIGGWSLSHVFPVLAASARARREFAKNCVGIIREYGVDGIDIHWEFPGYTPNGGTGDDAKNFILLLQDVRSALDAYQKVAYPNNEKTIGLTAALPCVPEMIAYQDIAGLNEVLTELSLKTFDFHGVWDDKIGVNAPLLDQPPEKFESPGMSVDGCMEHWVRGGADQSKINIGVPFYGRTYSSSDRLYGPHGGVDTRHWKEYGGTAQYYEILDNLFDMISLRDEHTKTQYAYFAEDLGLVSFDDNQSVCDKVEYSMENDSHGLYIWDLSGDLTESYSTPLLDIINLKLDRGVELDCSLFLAETRDEDGNVVPPPDTYPNPWYADWIKGGCLNDGMQSVYTNEEHLYRRKEECCAYKFENDFENCVRTALEEEASSSSITSSSSEELTQEDVENPNVIEPDMFTLSSATRSTLAAEAPPVTWCQGGCSDGHECVGNQNHPQTIDDEECKKCNLGQTFWPCDVDGLCFCWDPNAPRIPPAPSSGKAQLSNERPCDYFTEEKYNQLAPTAQHPYTYQGLCDAIDDYNDGHAEKAFMMGTEEERKAEFAAFLGHTLHESDEWRAGREYLICADNKIVDGEVYCKPCDAESFDWETFKCNGVGLVGDGLTYNGYCNYVIEPPLACACEELQSEPAPLDGYVAANKVFFGRGAIQTSWNYNYRSASDALTGDSSTFCENPDLIATTPKYAWGAGIFFWMENLKEETTCHIEALKNHDFGGTLNNINGGLECPAYHGGWHGEAIKMRINRYCKSSRALGLESILSFDGCKGLFDSFVECLGDGTCQECKHYSDGVPPPTNADSAEDEKLALESEAVSTTAEVATQNPTSPPVAAPYPPVSEAEVVTSQAESVSSCPSGLKHVDEVNLPDCCVPEPAYHGDGACDPDAPYNTAACNYDGGDCCKESCNLDSIYGCGVESFGYGPFGYFCQNPELEDEFIDANECTVSDKTRIGDGRCDAGIEVYNTAACNWDGGDCCEQTCDERYSHFDCGDPAYPFDCQNPDLDTVATTTTTTTTTMATVTSTTTTTSASGSVASSTSAFVVEVTDDATISKSDPDSNFGLAISLTVQGLSSGPNAIDSLMKFTIPPSNGAPLASAVLRVFSLADASSGGIFHLAPDSSLSDWQERSVTWNTAPDWEDRLFNIGAVSKDQWYTVDVSEAITNMNGAGGQLTIRIRSRDPGVASYSSLQGTHPPQILMSYGSADVVTNTDSITTATTVASSHLPSDSKVYFPSDDASIVQDHPDENHGLETELRIDQDTGVFDSLIRFDTSTINTNSVTSATLRLYCIDGSTSGGIFTTSAPNWDEESVTWANAPSSYDSEELGTLDNVYAGEWYELDVSKVFENPPNSLNKALSIRISSESWNRAVYSSKEGSNPPQLILQFSADQPNAETSTHCEEDVHICPDGSFLYRVASLNCEFEACPQYDTSSGSGMYYPLWGPGGSMTCVDVDPPSWALGAYLKTSKRECCKTYSALKVAKCLRM